MTAEVRGVFVLRLIAVAIAVLGLVDPVITMSGRSKATVAVITSGGSTDPVSELARRVRASLAKTFSVIDGPFANADALVVVGRDAEMAWAGAPAFVVTPDETIPRVDIESVEAPRRAPFDGRIAVTTHLRAVGAAGRTDRVTLRSGGVAIDRVTQTWSKEGENADVTLHFLAPATGVVPLRVSVEPEGDGPALASADVAVEVESRRWTVLAYDARPSWASTFVRRALEDDRRFQVVTRTVTSRGLSVETGHGVPGVGDATRLAPFDAILVGAPDALTPGDVTGLEAYARERGGTVVLMLDRAESGAAARLLGVDRFTTRQGSASVAITGAEAPGLKWLASEFALPESLPLDTSVLASATIGSATRATVWQSPKGAGRIVVSGALDAWRYRADPQTAFAPFWQTVVAAAAAAAPPLIDVRLSESMTRPGEVFDVDVMTRATGEPSPDPVSMRAWLERADGTRLESVRLWPDAMLGRLRARVQSPSITGAYRVVVTGTASAGATESPGPRGEASVLVAGMVMRPAPNRPATALAWARAHRGAMVPAARVGELPAMVLTAVNQQPQPTPVHPMRSGWWIVPFALVLGAEWWSRRRRGLA